ncbi:MAG: tRNA (guanosine(46)-N7)-methyltransferase TrmB [Oscillospiraceae bacterium]|nr:tRNA (guanosine(46)-N7)-methyltransferase TrmB [Oscillospiraceae bacterium]
MRLRNRPWAAPELADCPYYLSDFSRYRGHWREVFGNDRPIWLEIGCGKGLYLRGMASAHPELNFIGADIKSLMLAYARRNIEQTYAASGMQVDNIILLSVDAERILSSFSEEDTVDRIILNFSNPWPKPPHHKRRLTHPRQLENYKVFLRRGGIVEFKTDNDELYADSLGYFCEAGYSVDENCFDYYSSHEIDTSIITEHEQKFMQLGLPIHYIRAIR